MPWTQKQMLRDANGDLIPQYWDVAEQDFKPLTGQDGANDVRLTGSVREHEIFASMEKRAENSDYWLFPPDWAIGAIIQVSVNNIEGNFSGSYDGVQLRVRSYATEGLGETRARHQFSDISSERIKNTFGITAIIYPIPTIPENTYQFSVPVIHESILGDALRVYININGDFGENEGVTCVGHVQWLRR